jgi:glycosyltransferase involved in cell wall biosynthesis
MSSISSGRWVVLRETETIRWGGDLRRFYVLERLAERTAAPSIQGWGRPAIWAAIRASHGVMFPVRIGLGARPALGTTELLTIGGLALARRHFDLRVLDVHDHPIIQAEALSRPHAGPQRRNLEDRLRRNLDAFPIHLVPSASFGELAGVDPSRAVVIPNGTDTQHIVPSPFPALPRVGFVSGAAPGRGIELLIRAARQLRTDVSDLRLGLWLTGGDDIGEAYIDGIRAGASGDDWIEISTVAYEDLGTALATATVLVVPNRPHAYWDTAVPVKLLDSMAAGRPVVVTPRREAARIVEQADGGKVASGDSADDLAAAILPLLEDPDEAARLGANARLAAERDYDWRVLGDRAADVVLGGDGPGH